MQAAAAPGLNAAHDSDDDLQEFERRGGPRGQYDESSDDSDGGGFSLDVEFARLQEPIKCLRSFSFSPLHPSKPEEERRTPSCA